LSQRWRAGVQQRSDLPGPARTHRCRPEIAAVMLAIPTSTGSGSYCGYAAGFAHHWSTVRRYGSAMGVDAAAPASRGDDHEPGGTTRTFNSPRQDRTPSTKGQTSPIATMARLRPSTISPPARRLRSGLVTMLSNGPSPHPDGARPARRAHLLGVEHQGTFLPRLLGLRSHPSAQLDYNVVMANHPVSVRFGDPAWSSTSKRRATPGARPCRPWSNS